jgi:hypothetical protein
VSSACAPFWACRNPLTPLGQFGLAVGLLLRALSVAMAAPADTWTGRSRLPASELLLMRVLRVGGMAAEDLLAQASRDEYRRAVARSRGVDETSVVINPNGWVHARVVTPAPWWWETYGLSARGRPEDAVLNTCVRWSTATVAPLVAVMIVEPRPMTPELIPLPLVLSPGHYWSLCFPYVRPLLASVGGRVQHRAGPHRALCLSCAGGLWAGSDQRPRPQCARAPAEGPARRSRAAVEVRAAEVSAGKLACGRADRAGQRPDGADGGP